MRIQRLLAILGILGPIGFWLLGEAGTLPTQAAVAGAEVATPEFEKCHAPRRSAAELLEVIADQPAASASPKSPQPIPPGEPADQATVAEVTKVVRQLEACINTGDQLRVYALFSDDLFRQPMDPAAAAEVQDELVAWVRSTATPVPAGQRQILTGPWHVELLQDGRVLGAVRFSFEDNSYPSSVKVLFFTRDEGQWLIQEMADHIWIEGRDGLVPVEEIVGPIPNG